MTNLQDSNEFKNKASPVPSFRKKIGVLIAEYGLKSDRLVRLLQATSKGRVQSLSGLTEFEAMVIWCFLGGDHVSA